MTLCQILPKFSNVILSTTNHSILFPTPEMKARGYAVRMRHWNPKSVSQLRRYFIKHSGRSRRTAKKVVPNGQNQRKIVPYSVYYGPFPLKVPSAECVMISTQAVRRFDPGIPRFHFWSNWSKLFQNWSKLAGGQNWVKLGEISTEQIWTRSELDQAGPDIFWSS